MATNRGDLTYRKLEELHGIRQRNIVKRVYENAPFYRKKLEEFGITPSDITKSEDVEKLLFTRKTDLRNNFPFDLFAVEHEK